MKNIQKIKENQTKDNQKYKEIQITYTLIYQEAKAHPKISLTS